MFNQNIKNCPLLLLLLTAALNATESVPTKPVVGFKPHYLNATGSRLVSGRLMVGATLIVDEAQLRYEDKDGDPVDPSGTLYSWKLNNREVGTQNRIQLPTNPATAGEKLTLTVTPYSYSGDPKRGKSLELSDLRLAGATGGNSNGGLESVTLSQPYGQSWASDKQWNLWLGPSNKLDVRCGIVVDGLGTPELGMFGGSGGGYYQISGTGIVRMTIGWGIYSFAPGVNSHFPSGQPTLGRIYIEYLDGSTRTCGQGPSTYMTRYSEKTWTPPNGEKFNGIVLKGDAYLHEIIISSVAK